MPGGSDATKEGRKMGGKKKGRRDCGLFKSHAGANFLKNEHQSRENC